MKKVFWENPYQCSLETHVTSVEGRVVTFDATIAYSFAGAAHAANFTHPEPINHAMEKFLDYIIQDEAQNKNISPSLQVY